MDLSKTKSFVFGGAFLSFLVSILYFFFSHGTVKEIQKDLKEVHKFMKEVHQITHLTQGHISKE